jgi:peptide/nickel transport system substrate-binding protein
MEKSTKERSYMSLGKKTVALVGALALGATVFAMAPTATAVTTTVNGPAPAVPGAVKGGTLTILNQGDFEHVDPARNYVGGTLDFYRFFIRTLTQYRTFKGKTILVPDVAADLGTTKNGGKTWTFKLRTNLKYEDGSKITCADLKYGTMRSYNDDILDGGTTYAKDLLMNPTNYKGPYTQPKGDLTSVVCSPKGDAITYKLQQAVSYFPFVTTFGSFSPVPKAKDTKQNYDLHPVSSGPYKILSYNRGKQMTLVRNTNWDPKTDPVRWNYPDRIVVKFGFDQNALEQQLVSDSGAARTAMSLDTNVITNLPKILANKPKYQSRFFSFVSPYARYLAINMDTVKDLNVRRAIQCAIDLKTILLAAGGTNAGTYSNSLIPSSIKNGYRNFPICGRDVHKKPEAQIAAAKALLAAATNPKMDLILAYRDKGVEPDRAAAVQQALEAVGFTVTMSKLPRAGYYTSIGKRDVGVVEPDVIQTSWAYDWAASSGIVYALLDGRTMSATDSHSNYSRQNVPSLQALFAKADQITDPAKADKALGDIDQKAIQDYAAVVPSYFETSNFIVGSKLGGVQADGGYGTLSPLAAYVKK